MTRRILLLLCLLFGAHTAMADMGRVFFTPAERARLDELRANAKSVDISEQADPQAMIELAPPSDVSVQGYVKRSDGKKSTVWVNGKPVQENASGAGVEVGKLGNSNQVPITLPNSGKSLKLKAGQVYSPATDSVSEAAGTSAMQSDPAQAGKIGTQPAGERPASP